MRRYLFMSCLAGVFALTVGLAAQNPPSQPPPSQNPPSQNPPSQPPSQPRQPTSQPATTPSAQSQGATVTVEGCLMRERDVPGRQPNVAERAGVMEDYILTSAKVIKGSAPQSTTGAAAGTAATGTTAGTGTATGTTGTTGQRTPDATRAAGQPTTGTDAARTGAATAGASAAGMQPMFDVKNLDDDRLKPLVGKRVQIDGTFADVSRSQPAGSTEDLVDIQGSTIREVAGQCPAPKQ